MMEKKKDPKLTATDRALIELLRENARRPVSEMADVLGISRTTIKERMDRLKIAGVIKRYTVDVDLGDTATPLGVRAFFYLRLRRPVCHIVFSFIREWPELAACWSTTGDLDMFVLIEAANQNEMERRRDQLARHAEVAQLTTSMVLKTWAERYGMGAA